MPDSKQSRRVRIGELAILSALVVFAAHVTCSLMMNESWWQHDLIMVFVATIFIPPMLSLAGLVLCLFRRSAFWPATFSTGVVTLLASSAWALSCMTLTPFPIPVDLTDGYQQKPQDKLIVRGIYDPDIEFEIDAKTFASVVQSLQNGTRIWQDGSEQYFSCEIERDGTAVVEFEAMTSGNIVVNDRLYEGPTDFGEILQRAHFD